VEAGGAMGAEVAGKQTGEEAIDVPRYSGTASGTNWQAAAEAGTAAR
jgi:hypothetical protein